MGASDPGMVQRLRDWTTRLEEYWRDIHRDFIITNLQRLQWLEQACLHQHPQS